MLQVPDFQLKNRFRLDNPWWDLSLNSAQNESLDALISAKLPEHSSVRRAYFDALFDLIFSMQANRAVVLMGPRRVGKTYLLKQITGQLIAQGVHPQRIAYASLETPLYTGMPLEALLTQFQEILQSPAQERLYVIFDEIQYLPQWEVHLKVLVDRFPQHRFVASGSAAAALRMKSQESGAGRFTDFVLPPMSFAEFLQFKKIADVLMPLNAQGVTNPSDITALNNEFVAYLNYGGYPEAVLLPEVQHDMGRFIRSDIVDKVLLRDLPSLYGISNIQELNRLFTVLAFNTGREISLESLGKESGVVKNTLLRYLDYLEAAFLIQRLYRVDENARRMQRNRTFKVFLTNPAMRAALFGPLTEEDPAFGHVVETAVFANLVGQTTYENVAYGRWNKGEIDFLQIDYSVQKPAGALEVKWSDRDKTLEDAVNLLSNYSSEHKLKYAIVTTKSVSGASASPLVQFVPTAEYCYRFSKERHFFEDMAAKNGSTIIGTDFLLSPHGRI
jgi:uncharacterized protein